MSRRLYPYTQWPAQFKTDGTAQGSQRYTALDPAYFKPDDLSTEQLLSLVASLAKNLKFSSRDDTGDDSWHKLFYNSELVVLAQIAATDTQRLQRNWAALQQQGSRRQLNFLLTLLEQGIQWYQQLVAAGSSAALLLADKLASRWQSQLATPLTVLAEKSPQLAKLKSYFPLPEYTVASLPAGQALQRAFSAVVQLCRYLQQETASQLHKLMLSGHNEPALALLLTFLKLLQPGQQQLNTLTARHQAFYYDECLKMSWQSGQAAAFWLSLRLTAGQAGQTLPQHSRFSAGKGGDGKPQLFSSIAPQSLRDVQVSQLYHFSLLHSRRISPECELGFVSRIYSMAGTGIPETARPLFVADDDTERVPGFTLSSPTLTLSEGERDIELQLALAPADDLAVRLTAILQQELEWPQRLEQAVVRIQRTLPQTAAPYTDTDINALALKLPQLPALSPQQRWLPVYLQVLLQQAERCTDLDSFCRLFGMLFSYHLLGGNELITQDERQQLLEKANMLALRQGALHRVAGMKSLIMDDRLTVFDRYCAEMFSVSISTAAGYVAVPVCRIQPLGTDQPGLRLRLKLNSSFAAVCGITADSQPALQLLLNPRSRLCAYSLLSRFDLIHCHLSVNVTDARQLVLSNQLGPLDNTQPFWPFGPVPLQGHYLLFNHPDWQQKKLQRLELQLQWAELPADNSGFTGYYAGYGEDISNGSFKAAAALLKEGKWQPLAEQQQGSAFRLFSSEKGTERLLPTTRLCFENINDYSLTAAQAQRPYQPSDSSGFFRLALSHPAMAFGHQRYGTALSETVLYNARHKKAKPQPNAPYVPKIALISASYQASCDLYPGRDPQPGSQERLYQLYPFGQRQSYPATRRQSLRLLPVFSHQAYLFIGLQGDVSAGLLSLLFDIDPARGSSNSVPENRLSWHYLHHDVWHALPAQAVLADSTRGLTCPGQVLLQLPQALSLQHQLMPSGSGWLRICSPEHSRRYGNVHRVLPNAVQVRAENNSMATGGLETIAIPDAAGWQLQGGTLNAAVAAVLPARSGQATQQPGQRRQRIAERLSHKQRACTAWDYERLVLQAFPQLAKVKCFANASVDDDSSAPGQLKLQSGRLLLVVLGQPSLCQHDSCERVLVSGQLLREIRQFVAGIASPFARIEVSNPGFERLQVRCAVKMHSALHSGDGLRQLQQALSDYLCPWHNSGMAAQFGWQLRPQLLLSFVRQLPYVDFVTDFSVLHISEYGNRQYQLRDSAAEDRELVLHPQRPWNLLTPVRQHALQLLADVRPVQPEVTGVGELEIGQTFIIGQGKQHG